MHQITDIPIPWSSLVVGRASTPTSKDAPRTWSTTAPSKVPKDRSTRAPSVLRSRVRIGCAGTDLIASGTAVRFHTTCGARWRDAATRRGAMACVRVEERFGGAGVVGFTTIDVEDAHFLAAVLLASWWSNRCPMARLHVVANGSGYSLRGLVVDRALPPFHVTFINI